MKVIAYKLVSGEDILAEDCQSDGTSYNLKNPTMVGGYVDPRTQEQKIGLGPFPALSEIWRKGQPDRFTTIKYQHVVYSYTPTDELVVEYKKIFGSGIITPPATPSIFLG